MSAQKQYRFTLAEHWRQCLMRGFVADGDTLVPVSPIGPHASPTDIRDPLSVMALDAYGNLTWRHTGSGLVAWVDELGNRLGPGFIDDILAASPRLVAGGYRLWAFAPHTIHRYDRETLQLDRIVELDGSDESIADIAGDGRDGLWLLLHSRQGARLRHLDAEGCVLAELALTEAGAELATLGRGRTIVVLAEDRRRLLFIDATDADVIRERLLCKLGGNDTATAGRLATDSQDRIGLSCRQRIIDRQPDGGRREGTQRFLLLLDGKGEPLHEPLTSLFTDATEIADLALDGCNVWLATSTGLWTLGSSAATETAAATSSLLTPVLMSPVGDKRGWLRAEFMLDLPEGAALEVTFASTNDERLRNRVDQIARDDAMTQRDRLDRIWAEFETAQEARIGGLFVLEGAAVDEAPIAVPLYDSTDQWLWLKLELTIPASVGTPGLSEMRVLYPEISLMARLPTMFSEPRYDPEGTLRGIVGVLETTTQSIDETIGNIGRLFDARHAPDDWLDYLGSWLDLPWHDALPADIKRALLTKAGELIGLRGTRDGLRVLLGCLLGEKSIIDIVDLTVDYAPLRLSAGVTVPALLAGRRPTHVLGRMRLNCPPADCTPLATLVPTLRLALTVTSDTRRAIAPLLDAILDQFVPLGVRTVVSWQVQPAAMFLGEDDIVVLGTESGAALGEDSIIGRAQIGGRDRDHLTESGFEMGVRLR